MLYYKRNFVNLELSWKASSYSNYLLFYCPIRCVQKYCYVFSQQKIVMTLFSKNEYEMILCNEATEYYVVVMRRKFRQFPINVPTSV